MQVAKRVIRQGGQVDHRIDAVEITGLGVTHVFADMRHFGDGTACRKRAAGIEIAVEANDVMTRPQQHRHHNRSDVAQVARHQHAHVHSSFAATPTVSLHGELAHMEGLRQPFRGPTLHAAQMGQTHESFGIEPVLRPRRAEWGQKQLDVARQRCLCDPDVDIGPLQIAVPLRDLIFQDEVVAECVPCKSPDLAMVLVRITAPMAEDDLGYDTRLERLEPRLDLGTLVREIAILEPGKVYRRAGGAGQKGRSRRVRLLSPLAGGAEHCPADVKEHTALDPSQNRCAGADLYVIGVSTDAENRQPLPRGSKAENSHPALLLTLAEPAEATPSGHHGMMPRSTRSSSTSLSLSVSIGRQKPSCRNAKSWSASISRWNGASTSSSPSRR